jgi:hypothetical protein
MPRRLSAPPVARATARSIALALAFAGRALAAQSEATIAVDRDAPRAVAIDSFSVAVVIGNRNYQHQDLPAVEYAHNDARAIEAYLRTSFGIRPGNVIAIADASKAALEQVFGTRDEPRARLWNRIREGKQVTVYVYYSGHGAPDEAGRTYLVPSDADPSLLRISGYPVDQLYKNLSELPATKVVVLMDACFSGSSPRGMLIKNASPGLLKVENPAVAAKNMAVLSAAAKNEIASWVPEQQHGAFTYWLLRGIRQQAANAPGAPVSLRTLHAYVADNVKYETQLQNRVQSVQLVGQAADQPIVILAPGALVRVPEPSPALAPKSVAAVAAAEPPAGASHAVQPARQRVTEREPTAAASAPQFRAGASAVDGAALFREGKQAADAGQDPKAVALYHRACDAGNASGCSNLGIMYQKGRGVAQDFGQALALYQRACDSGTASGCTNLGLMYANGDGVAQDAGRAVALYQRACDAGSAVGCTYLGFMHKSGRGVAQDDGRAVALFQRACDARASLGCAYLGEMYQRGRGVATDSARADALKKQACQLGRKESC